MVVGSEDSDGGEQSRYRASTTKNSGGRGWAPKARRIAAGHRGVARARFGLGLLPQTLDDGGDVGQSLLRYRQPPWLEPEEAPGAFPPTGGFLFFSSLAPP